VHEPVARPGVEIVGREAELERLEKFLDGSSTTLVLSGGSGIGKTTLWEAGIEAARRRDIRVLSSRANGAEAKLSFAGLIDLLDRVSADELAELPDPQRRALEVALLRAAPGPDAPEPGVIAVGLLSVLRSLAGRGRLLVAVDDVQWLDPPSAAALTFVARRLEPDAAGFLLARRPGRPSALERALEAVPVVKVELAPLSLGSTRRLLSDRLGMNVPRHVLRQLVDSTLGNPLFALELGRTLLEQGLPKICSHWLSAPI
jgi:predicted ATPase